MFVRMFKGFFIGFRVLYPAARLSVPPLKPSSPNKGDRLLHGTPSKTPPGENSARGGGGGGPVNPISSRRA